MKISFRGKEYSTLSSCYKDNKDIATVGLATIRNRLKSGLSLEVAFTQPRDVPNTSKFGTHIVEDVEYENLPAIAKAYDMTTDAVYKRHSRGCRGDNLVPQKKRKNYSPPKLAVKSWKSEIEIGGKKYKSALQACTELDINYATYRRRHYQGWTKEQIFGLEPKEDGRSKKRKIYILNDQQFSMKELSEKFKVSVPTIADRLNRGASLEQAVGIENIEKAGLTKQAQYRKQNVKKRSPIILEAFGKTYNSYKKLADAFSLPYYTVRDRILLHGYTPEEAVKAEGKAKKVVVAGVEYNSQASAATAHGITLHILLGRMSKGLTIEQALRIEEYDTANTIIFESKKYRNLSHLAAKKKLSVTKIRSRMVSGLSLEEAINAGDRIYNQGRYNETILSRNPKLAESEAELYFIKFFFDEKTYFKVGITTKNVNDRIRGEGFQYETIITVNNTLMNVWKLEREILLLVQDKRANFSAEILDGYSEVVNLTNEEASIIKELIKTYSFD